MLYKDTKNIITSLKAHNMIDANYENLFYGYIFGLSYMLDIRHEQRDELLELLNTEYKGASEILKFREHSGKIDVLAKYKYEKLASIIDRDVAKNIVWGFCSAVFMCSDTGDKEICREYLATAVDILKIPDNIRYDYEFSGYYDDEEDDN